MPRYEVYLNVTRPLKEPLIILADDEYWASVQAVDMMLEREDILEAEVVRVKEI